jgi:hypothetical protein
MVKNCAEPPAHIAVSPEAVTTGEGMTDMLTESLAEHLPGFTVMTYLVLAKGLA